MTTLPDGAFDKLTSLYWLHLGGNQLTTLPDGAFDNLAILLELNLENNHLVGLKKNDRLFARLPDGLTLELGDQTEAQHE